MVGIVVKHGAVLVVATGVCMDEAQEVALDLLEAEGVILDEASVDMIIFDPEEKGGVLFNMEEPPDMEGWGPDGFTG